MDIELKGLKFQVNDDFQLRQFEKTDADAVFKTVQENCERLKAFMHWMTDDYSIDHVHAFIDDAESSVKKRESCGFGIFRGIEVKGAIGFVNFDWTSRRTELGYWISRDEEGKGLVTRASKILISHAICEWNMNRIEIRCATMNTRSSAVPKRLGFTLEGTLRQFAFRNGQMHDFYVFGLLSHEWKC